MQVVERDNASETKQLPTGDAALDRNCQILHEVQHFLLQLVGEPLQFFNNLGNDELTRVDLPYLSYH